MSMKSKTSPKLSPACTLQLLLLLCSTMISSMVAAQHQEPGTETSHNTIRCIERERQALLRFKQGLVDPYGLLTSWGSLNEEDQYHHRDCCQWSGVGCRNDTGHVISLDLRSTQYNESGFPIFLQGNISASLLVLEHLSYLDLSGNDFLRYPIPNFIGSLVKLTYLNLSNSNLSGEIPPRFKNLSNLQSLDLSHYNLLHAKNLAWASGLSSLKTLNLRDVELANATDWVHVINNLPSLTYLNLAYCSLPNPSPASQFNASKSLSFINLGGNNLPASSVYPWLFNISGNLVEIVLPFNGLQGPIPKELGNMNSVSHLDLSFNNLQGPIPEAIANWSSLSYLDLSGNQLQGSIPETFRSGASLAFLDLSSNELQGTIPDGIGSLSSLKLLALSSNRLEGGIPDSFRHLCSLRELYLSGNNLSVDLFVALQSLSGCIVRSLEALSLGNNSLSGPLLDLKRFPFPSLIYLDLSYNRLNGSFPSFSNNYPSLVSLYLQKNQLTGSLPEDFGQLSKLQWVDLSSNALNGTINEAHFSNLSQLTSLRLSFNELLAFNLSPKWTPPFQLLILSLESCGLGPDFPYWLQTQNSVDTLTLSNAGISDTLPSWFFTIFRVGAFVNLSHNEIHGMLPDSGLQHFVLRELDLSFNSLEGSIPSFLTQVGYLELSNNKLSGSISSWSQRDNKLFSLQFLDISYNNLSGELPDCWMDINTVKVLNLGSNGFTGKIPSSFGNLISLEVLNLGANELSGEVPSSIKNCTSLRILDLSANSLSGQVPSWLGNNLFRLNILILRENKFSGNLPLEICHLHYLQILDLSINNIFGTIPSCLNNITALSSGDNFTASQDLNASQWTSAKVSYFSPYIIGTYLIDKVNIYAYLVWKGSTREYWQNLALVRSIDLSNNKFGGEIPMELSSLTRLQSLNLSRNHLTGPINPNLDNLSLLESLDLSRNQLSGEIPASFSKLNFLSFLDLSYNNLFGEIPSSTQLQSFNESSYVGNDGLCGSPLQLKCQDDEAETSPHGEEAEDQDDDVIYAGLYISVGLGFATGFWAVFGMLLYKRSWRYACFRFWCCVFYKIVAAVTHITQLIRNSPA